jgi:hypothetical protein
VAECIVPESNLPEDTALVYSELTEACCRPRGRTFIVECRGEAIRDASVDQADRVIFESHCEICDQCREAAIPIASFAGREHFDFDPAC